MTISTCRECGFSREASETDAGPTWTCPSCGRAWVVSRPALLQANFSVEPHAEASRTKSSRFVLWSIVGLSVFVGVLAVLGVALYLLNERKTKALALLSPQCQNNVRTISLALVQIGLGEAGQGHFPAAAITDKQGKPLLSWRVVILPYIGHQDLHKKFHLDEPWDSPHNLALLKLMPAVFQCPGDPKPEEGMTNYQVIVGPDTIFTPDFKPVAITDIPDGGYRTFLFGESPRKVPWTKPEDLPININLPLHGLGNHDGFYMGFADGHARYFKSDIEPTLINAILTRNGQEDISALDTR